MGILKSLGIDGTFIAELVNFVGLLLLLSWRAFPRARQILNERRQRVETALVRAEEERAEGVRLKEQREAELQQARVEAQAILERAERAATEQLHQVVDEARQQAERLRQQAEEAIAGERDRAILALRQEVGDMAVAVAEKLMRHTLDEALDRQLVEAFVSEVAEG